MRDEDDYYELLQISPRADLETIQRVHRSLAARFHPDNWRTGDVDRFLALNRAYEVLSDPKRRAKYDAERQTRESRPLPIFELEDFVYGFESEVNRRLGVLALLYHRRRSSPEIPGISVLDLENRMAFPREFFTFTLWYLRSKNLIEMTDSSDYTLTPTGVDYLEQYAGEHQVIRKLLGFGSLTGSDRCDKPVVSGDVAFDPEQLSSVESNERVRRVA